MTTPRIKRALEALVEAYDPESEVVSPMVTANKVDGLWDEAVAALLEVNFDRKKYTLNASGRMVVKDIGADHRAVHCPRYTTYEGNGHGLGCPQHAEVM